ncbi:uncharacterized protein LOC122501804 [Leptopilina heterotoma]|uniref:uncharacterized protein LOC122501804 n=1 Tax=Leptopilina heterotoma TaxID=63436 RepID=UPI001CA8980C|nr:uncharacterized protein LOC122501804 [Leptopilina heterotoma]
MDQNNYRQIILKFGDESQNIFVENNKLNKSTLEEYFPKGSTLKYILNGESFLPNADASFIHLNPAADEYLVSLPRDFLEDLQNNIDIKKKNVFLIKRINEYFNEGCTHTDIVSRIRKSCNIQLSLRTLSRIMRKYAMKRKNIKESPIEEIAVAILLEIEDSGHNLGYRAMWKRLQGLYKLKVKQKTVMKLLRIIDPEGVETRSRYKLKRRIYNVPGPNFIWHADNHDKLKRFGFPIYGCIDGYSRKVLWIEVSRTNNNPAIIGSYFLKAIEKCKFLPTLIRTDKGTEANLMEDLHMALRHSHNDEFSGTNSFLRGKSTRNQRIESYWRQFRQHMGDFYINLFKKMEEDNLLNVSNRVHIECLRYCFELVIKEDIRVTIKEWNEHRVRKQNNRNVVGGIPNMLFECPEMFGATDWKKEVDLNHVSFLKKYTEEPYLISPIFKEFADDVLQMSPQPSTAEEAYNLYVKLINMIEKL